MGINEKFIFTELEDKDLSPVMGMSEKVPVFPIEGPTILNMRLSERQFRDLKKQLETTSPQSTNGSSPTYNLTLIGITKKDGADSPKTCSCDLNSLMIRGCTCGKP
jgi:hypothetical protein